MSVTQTNARIAHCQIGFSLCRRNEAKQKKQYLGQTIFEYSIEVLVSSQRHVENCPEVNGYFHLVRSHHSKMQTDGWAKYIPNFAFK